MLFNLWVIDSVLQIRYCLQSIDELHNLYPYFWHGNICSSPCYASCYLLYIVSGKSYSLFSYHYTGLGHSYYAENIQGTWLFVGFSSDPGLFSIYSISGNDCGHISNSYSDVSRLFFLLILPLPFYLFLNDIVKIWLYEPKTYLHLLWLELRFSGLLLSFFVHVVVCIFISKVLH